MIQVKNLTKKYGNNLAVKNASFTIQDGEVVGFLGPNGAGKSTIMNIMTGYLSLTSGNVEVAGYDILEYPEQAKKHIGYLPELPPLYPDMTVKEYLSFVYELKKAKFQKKPHLDEIERLVNIKNVENRLIKNLSKGYRQRVGIAQALIGNPDVLILDEPTVGLDPKQIIEIRSLIEKLGRHHTVIVSSHILSEIQAVCKRIIIINQGVIVADDTAENLQNSLSSDHALSVRIQGPEETVLKVLKSIKEIENVQSLGIIESGSFDCIIEPRENCDVRRAVFDRMSERKWPILSMSSNRLTLEQIFLRLTDSSATAVQNAQTAEDAESTETAELTKEEIEMARNAVYGKEDK
ncbi:MAG: ATP-binding cassette domain-containing protein [Oscillospiraceae bacterium]|nr:ATP-binding cassette domain-containing protein [Candidatus Equicaccousia limihippi]